MHQFFVILIGILFLVDVFNTIDAEQLCADDTGVFIGLATDEDAYTSIPGSVDSEEADSVVQSWILTTEYSNSNVDPHPHSGTIPPINKGGPQHSYDGRFLQVLPDSGRSYPSRRGKHIQHAAELDDDIRSPYVSFSLKVTKERVGIHTLFLRWTGGDTVGGGDSLYVVLYKTEKKKKGKSTATTTLVHGQQTVKPAVVPIDAGMSRYIGCCYDMTTHACPCYSEQPTETICSADRFIDRSQAATFGVQCRVGGGAMVIVKAPEWYLYAGQEAGDVMDFDSEPWDVTCEADGSNTIDSGHDFPSWRILEHGDYELRVYAREDGTALDGIYVAGPPSGQAPIVSRRYVKGDSTICKSRTWWWSSVGKKTVLVTSIVGMVCVCVVLLVLSASTQTGKEILSTVISKPAQAVRYVYVDNS